LTENEFQKILSRAKINGVSKDYVRVNGTPYVVGESAERHGLVSKRSGASRYTRDYYGVLTATVLAQLYGRGREVAVFGSHAPGDVGFREDQMRSVIGDWEVEIGGSRSHFKVIYANTFDEPVGGLMNVLLAEDGQHFLYTHVRDGRVLVIDIGGFTTDFLAVSPGGVVDYSLARSVPLGIQSVISDFEDSFKANQLEAVKDTPILPPDRVRKAIATGVFEGGGRKFSCEQDVEEDTSLILN
jgi:hypothetical protein